MFSFPSRPADVAFDIIYMFKVSVPIFVACIAPELIMSYLCNEESGHEQIFFYLFILFLVGYLFVSF